MLNYSRYTRKPYLVRVNTVIRKLMRKITFCSLLLIFFSQSNTCNLSANDNSISVYSNIEKGKINKKIFGSNFIGYDPTTFEKRNKPYFGYSDFGAGIWDSKWNRPVEKVIELGREAGISILRFPGGCGTHHYNWKDAIGKKRKHFLYGIDEFLETCKELDAEPIITVSYFTGNEHDAADLIEYLNMPIDIKNETKKRYWANERVRNGHYEPYFVKYFEIGNEVYHGDHQEIKIVSSEEYATNYLKYYDAMKAIDPRIKIGAVLYKNEWNKVVLSIIKGKIDFAIIHTYPSTRIKGNVVNDIFASILAVPLINDEDNFRNISKLLYLEAGKQVPLAITEFNGGFFQDKPVPYRHCLGTALLNAELLRIFMKPKNNILMANYWQFCNSYWGMIANGFNGAYKTLYNPYYKRPSYYVFKMYHKYFGDVLISTDVKCHTYDASMYQAIKSLVKRLKTGTLINNNLISGGWVISKLPGVHGEEKAGILNVDFIDPAQFNYYHARKTAMVEPGVYYKLSGYIKTEGLFDENGVCLEVQDAREWNQTKSITSTEKIKGTTDWQYVEVIYETLPDAKAVNIIARRIGEKGPLKGKAYFKDVKLEKFISLLDTKIPYLSVNASKTADGKRVYLMVINKNMDAPMTMMIDLKDFTPAAKGNAWVLNGSSVDATNEKKHDNVEVTQREFEIKGNPFEFTFEPHSLTAIEIMRE